MIRGELYTVSFSQCALENRRPHHLGCQQPFLAQIIGKWQACVTLQGISEQVPISGVIEHQRNLLVEGGKPAVQPGCQLLGGAARILHAT
ncbi:hypothetical protein D3C72_2321380 [compost metagenome]